MLLSSIPLSRCTSWSKSKNENYIIFYVFSSNWTFGRKHDCRFVKTLNCCPILWHGKCVPLTRSWRMTTTLYFVQFLLIEPWEGNTITDLTRLLILVHCCDMESDKTNKHIMSISKVAIWKGPHIDLSTHRYTLASILYNCIYKRERERERERENIHVIQYFTCGISMCHIFVDCPHPMHFSSKRTYYKMPILFWFHRPL